MYLKAGWVTSALEQKVPFLQPCFYVPTNVQVGARGSGLTWRFMVLINPIVPVYVTQLSSRWGTSGACEWVTSTVITLLEVP